MLRGNGWGGELVSVFKLFIFTVVKNLALNKRTRGPDLP